MSIITLSKITENLKSFEYNSFLYSWTLFILAEDNWNNEDIVLKENEILINRPFFPIAAVGNSINIQDEQGFRYRKTHDAKHFQHWTCLRRNKGCKVSIRIRGEIITVQRNEHNHTAQVYRQLRKCWIQLLSSILKWFILAEDNWSIEDYIPRDDEILINRPFFSSVGMRNSIIVQDEHGFKYRKAHENMKKFKHIQNWKCSKVNEGCKVFIKTYQDTIISQRHEHNHAVQDYKKFWIQTLSLFLQFIYFFQRTTGLLKTMFSKKTKSWSIGPSFLVLAWEIQLLYRMSMASSTVNLTTQDMQHIFKIGNVRKLTKAANVPSKPKETP